MSVFTGTSTFTTTNSNVAGPFQNMLNLAILFSDDLTQVSLGSFPSITGKASTPLGTDKWTMTLKSGIPGNGTGTFDSATGKLVLTLALELDNSIIFAGTSDMLFIGPQSMTTETCTSQDGKISLTGSRFDSTTGAITLVGTTRISGGYLGGSDCTLTITGTLSTPSGHGVETKLWMFPSDGTAPTMTWDSGPGNWEWSRAAWLVGDFTGDGRDQIAAMYNYPGSQTGLWVFPSDGTAPTETWNSGPGNWDWSRAAWLVGDFTGDGKDQIAAMYWYGSS